MSVRFTVTGENRARLEEAAAQVLVGYSQGRDYTFVIEARPAVEAMDGRIALWHGDVEAWPTKEDPASRAYWKGLKRGRER